MAEKDDNKDGKNGDEGNKKTLTTEEIEAIAKKAQEALDKDDDKDDDDTGDNDDNDENDDDDAVDPKDAEKTLKYIEKLKDENAKRRIAKKKIEKKLAAQTKELQDAAKALKAATEKLQEVDTKTAEQKAKEKTDLENAQQKIEELQKKVDDLNAESEQNKIELAKTNKRVLVQDRENMIERLVKSQDVKFSSDFEREGLVRSLVNMDGEGFEKDDEEVIYDVMKFIKDKKATAIDTPGPGPGNRKTSTPLGDEVKALLAEKNLSKDQKARLDELLKLSGGA